MDLGTGIVLVAIAVFPTLIGRPNREGVHPSFLRFHAATVLYPPFIMASACSVLLQSLARS